MNSRVESSATEPALHAPKKGPPLPAGPLWGTADRWREANETMAYLVRHFAGRFAAAAAHAQNLRTQLENIFPHLDRLCRQSCPYCPEPCCLVATVWIDYKDLAFLHLAGHPPPSAPLIETVSDSCRYAGPRGCRLDRIRRPWVCSWYLCPTQTAILRGHGKESAAVLDRAFAAVKRERALMEDRFIAAQMGLLP